jgi:hypothetical protein
MSYLECFHVAGRGKGTQTPSPCPTPPSPAYEEETNGDYHSGWYIKVGHVT